MAVLVPSRLESAVTHLRDLEDGLSKCVHCGLCLPTCPTFAELGTEMDSPRGRILLIKSWAEGRIEPTDSVVEHLSLCLDCRACMTACPSGVPYGELIEAAKAEVERIRPGSVLRRVVRSLAFEWLLPSPRALGLLAAGMRFYQRSGLQALLRKTGLVDRLPSPLPAWEALLPPLPPPGDRAPLPDVSPADGTTRSRVGFLHGCIQEVIFAGHNRATVRLLNRNGAEVVTAPAQRCCGALHAHAGDLKRARTLARHNIEVFEGAGVEAIIVNAAGCGAHMKAYGHLLKDDPTWHQRAHAFEKKVQDVSEFLAREPLAGPLGRLDLRVTYHDPCHLAHGQKVRVQARKLLKAIPGLELVELAESDFCCGSAGIYNLTEPEMAERLLERKVNHIAATGAQAVVTANPGCILQIVLGLRRRGLSMRVLHLVELLDLAYKTGR